MNGSGDPPRRGRRRSGGSLDQWMSAGRQLVDGVAGARPGSRAQARGAERRAGGRPGLEGLGRWVENRIDWFLEGDDDWPEPWQERAEAPERRRPPLRQDGSPWQPQDERQPPPPLPPQPPLPSPLSPQRQPSPRPSAAEAGARRPLEAISRRAAPLLPPARAQAPIPPAPGVVQPLPEQSRPLPRSSRRPRQG
ncbi:hypothetical protein KQ304_11455 [Synechococcus sp. CS-1329]|uniref:hypothetical protein n=1 Tax=Synechococcus sp. CS-1329 TaxID=2847975 RepID=UPI00223B2D17|nr:hypothetical protein [Synechococcus sp. CS-1329]MCT0219602.1 hypothetical protein [Synechococcus sp. CS-1329]